MPAPLNQLIGQWRAATAARLPVAASLPFEVVVDAHGWHPPACLSLADSTVETRTTTLERAADGYDLDTPVCRQCAGLVDVGVLEADLRITRLLLGLRAALAELTPPLRTPAVVTIEMHTKRLEAELARQPDSPLRRPATDALAQATSCRDEAVATLRASPELTDDGFAAAYALATRRGTAEDTDEVPPSLHLVTLLWYVTSAGQLDAVIADVSADGDACDPHVRQRQLDRLTATVTEARTVLRAPSELWLVGLPRDARGAASAGVTALLRCRFAPVRTTDTHELYVLPEPYARAASLPSVTARGAGFVIADPAATQLRDPDARRCVEQTTTLLADGTDQDPTDVFAALFALARADQRRWVRSG